MGQFVAVRVLLLLLLVSPYLRALDPWRTPPSNWTQQDVARLLADSPWALPVDATMDDPADRPEDASSSLPPGVAEAGLPTNAKQGATPRWDGGIGKNRMGHLATIPVTVRWDSAAVMRHALERTNSVDSTALDAAAKGNFIITLIGLLPARQAKAETSLNQKSSSDGDNAVRTGEDTLEWFMSKSRLWTKGHAAIQPQNVKVDAGTGAVQLFFSRSDAMLAQKRDVLFFTRFGNMNVQARFRTKDMQVDGKPDL